MHERIPMEHQRPANLAYRAANGIVEVHFPPANAGGIKAFNNFVSKAMAWAGLSAPDPKKAGPESRGSRILLLDTFFGDTLETERLRDMLVQPCPMTILLSDPRSPFSAARAASANQTPVDPFGPTSTAEDRLAEGLRKIAEAIHQAARERGKTGIEPHSVRAEIREVADWIRNNSQWCNLTVKYYTVVPGGPMYFFNDLVLVGRYAFGRSSIELPWQLIINDPHVDTDLYDVLRREFQSIDDRFSSPTLLPKEPDPHPKLYSDAEPADRPRQEKTLRIFLSSSKDLISERDAFELYFLRENHRLRRLGIYLEIVRWEQSLSAVSHETLQSEYNRAVRESDIFVGLYFLGVGGYSYDEFKTAYENFEATGLPRIFTYFKDGNVGIHSEERRELHSLDEFKRQLSKLGHFPMTYKSMEDLNLHFKGQLQLLLEAERIATPPQP